jgi:hypothetical protein
MSTYYYLSSTGLNDLELDSNAIDVTFSQVDRAYTVDNHFSNGAIINGTGSLIPGQVTISLRFRKIYTLNNIRVSATSCWNAYKTFIMRYFGLAKNQPVYINVLDSSGNTLQQRIYPMSKSSEKYSSLVMSNTLSLTFQMENAYLYNTTANSTNYTVLTTTQELFSVSNNGIMPVSPLFSFVPSQGLTSFQIQLYYGNYGFTLSTTFLTGQTITFDCGTSIVTQNGNVVSGIQSQGSRFEIPVGTVQMYITACPGVLTTSFNERYI